MNYLITEINRKEAQVFLVKYHYSKSINGVIADKIFGLFEGDNLIGVALFGRMAMAGQWKKFSTDKDKVLELRRFALSQNLYNQGSWFLSRCLKLLKERIIVSYSDMEYGHTGALYKATNFKLVSTPKPQKVILYKGKLYHDKCIRTKYKGNLKPFAKRIKDALIIGEAVYKTTAGKYCWRYN